MVKLSHIRPGTNLLGMITADVWLRQGSGNRYYLHQVDFETMQEAQAFCWEHDRDMLIVKLTAFIEQVSYNIQNRWYVQRKWISTARPQIDEMRTYLAHIRRNIQAPEVMAEFTNLVALALQRSQPYSFIASAVTMWAMMYDLATDFVKKYHPEYCTQPETVTAG